MLMSSSMNRRQIALPMPPAAPVTTATRFFRPLILSLRFVDLRSCALRSVAKLEFLDLAGRRPLDRTEDEFARQLEFRQPPLAEFEHLVGRNLAVVTFLELDED